MGAHPLLLRLPADMVERHIEQQWRGRSVAPPRARSSVSDDDNEDRRSGGDDVVGDDVVGDGDAESDSGEEVDAPVGCIGDCKDAWPAGAECNCTNPHIGGAGDDEVGSDSEEPEGLPVGVLSEGKDACCWERFGSSGEECSCANPHFMGERMCG